MNSQNRILYKIIKMNSKIKNKIKTNELNSNNFQLIQNLLN